MDGQTLHLEAIETIVGIYAGCQKPGFLNGGAGSGFHPQSRCGREQTVAWTLKRLLKNNKNGNCWAIAYLKGSSRGPISEILALRRGSVQEPKRSAFGGIARCRVLQVAGASSSANGWSQQDGIWRLRQKYFCLGILPFVAKANARTCLMMMWVTERYRCHDCTAKNVCT